MFIQFAVAPAAIATPIVRDVVAAVVWKRFTKRKKKEGKSNLLSIHKKKSKSGLKD